MQYRSLRSLSDKKDKDFIGTVVFHAKHERVLKFTVARVTNDFFYDITNKKFKRTLCYNLYEDAELKQLKINLTFLGKSHLGAEKYIDMMTTLLANHKKDLL